MKKILLIIFVGLFCVNLEAQSNAQFTTVEEVVKTIYKILSGPAGDRDWQAFKSLFHSTGTMGAVIVSKDGNTRTFYQFTPNQYIKNNDAFLKKNDFFEEEIGRKKTVFGGIAQVYSAFQYKFSKKGAIEARGVNSIQLAKEKGRWWITNLVWEDESIHNKIPQVILYDN